jgi:hypothetical protein
VEYHYRDGRKKAKQSNTLQRGGLIMNCTRLHKIPTQPNPAGLPAARNSQIKRAFHEGQQAILGMSSDVDVVYFFISMTTPRTCWTSPDSLTLSIDTNISRDRIRLAWISKPEKEWL